MLLFGLENMRPKLELRTLYFFGISLIFFGENSPIAAEGLPDTPSGRSRSGLEPSRGLPRDVSQGLPGGAAHPPV